MFDQRSGNNYRSYVTWAIWSSAETGFTEYRSRDSVGIADVLNQATLGRGERVTSICCPNCQGKMLHHYTDAYVIRTPVINDAGELELLDNHTNEYDDNFFECFECGYRPSEEELVATREE
jgi:hypothetical protein